MLKTKLLAAVADSIRLSYIIRVFNVRHCDCYLIITLSMIPGLGYYLTNIPIVSHGKVGKCKLDATG